MEGSTVLGYLLLAALAYLAGSLPMGVIVAKVSGGPDPRTVGSGRTGGTNALRALGRKRAAIVVAGDLLKGALPVVVARVATNGDVTAEVVAGGAAVAGAIWSVFVGFRGGRGVGTGVGTMLVIEPLVVAIVAPIFVIVILVTRYVSLGSLFGSAAVVPALVAVAFAIDGSLSVAHLAWGFVGTALIWLAHADNIDRLRHGTERKFDLSLLSGRRAG